MDIMNEPKTDQSIQKLIYIWSWHIVRAACMYKYS